MKNHRERILEIIKFVQEKYLTYSREYIRELLEEDKMMIDTTSLNLNITLFLSIFIQI